MSVRLGQILDERKVSKELATETNDWTSVTKTVPNYAWVENRR